MHFNSTIVRQNDLLNALSATDLKELLLHMELAELPKGRVLYQPGTDIRSAYFPVTSIVSLQYGMAHGATPEVAVVGKEGMVGVSILLGGDAVVTTAIVESAGLAFRLPSTTLRKEFRHAGRLQRLLLIYAQSLTTELAQSLACLKAHTLFQYVCRWLLRRFDRLPSNVLQMSQESIAHLLNVRRSSISEIAKSLKFDQVISYSRGFITLLDRGELEKRSCECYENFNQKGRVLLPT
jgi:CRP-like cAMP-binding protein